MRTALIAVLVLCACKEDPTIAEARQEVLAQPVFDVVVVGAGAGGISAAIEARRKGLTVALLRGGGRRGRAARVAGGVRPEGALPPDRGEGRLGGHVRRPRGRRDRR